MVAILDPLVIVILALNFVALGVSRIRGVINAVAFQGVLLGMLPFGLLVDRTGSYAWPWLALAVVGLGVAATLPRPAPLVQREPIG